MCSIFQALELVHILNCACSAFSWYDAETVSKKTGQNDLTLMRNLNKASCYGFSNSGWLLEPLVSLMVRVKSNAIKF